MNRKTEDPKTLYGTPDRHMIKIYTGAAARDYKGGDFLNALDELVSWFENETDLSTDHIAALMDVYAAELRG